MAEITLDNFNQDNGEMSEANGKADRGTFEAPHLTAEIKDADGNTLAMVDLEPRAYTPNDKGKGGVGWFGQIERKNPAKYRDTVPLTGQVRLSVQGLKIGKTDKVRFK
jgi:hypothetical protein